jgi:hypothetical protein
MHVEPLRKPERATPRVWLYFDQLRPPPAPQCEEIALVPVEQLDLVRSFMLSKIQIL